MTRLRLVLFVLLLLVVANLRPVQSAKEPTQLKPILVAQLGHIYVVSSVAFSPDGQLVVSGSHDNTAHVWHARSGRELRVLRGHTDWINCVAFTPDSKHVLTGSSDKTARLWDAQTGESLVTFAGHQEGINAVAISSDGRLVATASEDHTATVFEALTGKSLFVLTGHKDDLRSIAFSPDGKRLITGSDDQTARIWNTETGKELKVLSGYDSRVTNAVFSLNGQQVLTASWDKTIRISDAQSGRELRKFVRQSNYPFMPGATSFSPDAKFVATGSYEGVVRLWNVETGQELHSFKAHEKEISGIAFSPDELQVATASHDDTARLWNSATGERLASFQGYSGWVLSASFSPDGKRLLTHLVFADNNTNMAVLWNLETGKQQQSLRQKLHINEAMFSPNGRQVLTMTWDGTAHLFDASTGQELRTFVGFKGDASGIAAAAAISPDGQEVVTANLRYVCFWNTETGAETKCLPGPGAAVHAISFSPDGRQVLIGSGDRVARLWNVDTGREVKKFGEHTSAVGAVAFSADGKLVLTGSEDKKAILWDVQSGKPLRRFQHDGWVNSVAFSPDNKQILTAGEEGTATVWDLNSGVKTQTYRGHTGELWGASFSPDGKNVVTASGDHTARLWDVGSGQELCSLISFTDGTWAVVDPQGRFDTNNLEEIRGLHWIISDDPLYPMPVEIFMRDYFEPALLQRTLGKQLLPDVKPVGALNRSQPVITIKNIVANKDSKDLVDVTIEVTETKSRVQRDNKGEPLRSGAYDLRLFRDGQIVAETKSGETSDEVATWKRASRLQLDKSGRAMVEFRSIQLPRKQGTRQVEFSAYAFNEDRVKSETSRKVFDLGTAREPVKPKAYLITVGVSDYQNPAWNLGFAADDAALANRDLVQVVSKSGEYEPVSIPLLSKANSSQGSSTATKANFKEVLELLSGDKKSPSLLSAFPDAAKVRKATPDDVVIIFFSSHGLYRRIAGVDRFYFLPSDIGKGDGLEETPALFAHAISSDELAQWLKKIDAGEMVLIANACQSEATIKNQGFKPGPLGNKGFGQLAYDKRMKILAASQALGSALETTALSSSVLTRALFREGIERNQADYNPKDRRITLSEWLHFAEDRVPEICRELKYPEGEIQQPVLFEFLNNKRTPTVLMTR